MRLITDMFALVRTAEVPNWNTISISGYHIREAGSTAAQELAFTLADGIAYVQAAVDAGLDVDDFAPRLSFFFNVHNNLLEEVAKFRAARRMWARIMRERFGAKNRRQLAAALSHADGGQHADRAAAREQRRARRRCRRWPRCWAARSRSTPTAWTRRWGFPSDDAARIALRTQQVILEESRRVRYHRPARRQLPHRVADRRRSSNAPATIMDEVDEMGGMIRAIESGFPQREIERAAYDYQLALESGDAECGGRQLLHRRRRGCPRGIHSVIPALEKSQVAELRKRRSSRDQKAVDRFWHSWRPQSQGDIHMFPTILDAVKANATIGEICTTLANTFGRYRERRRNRHDQRRRPYCDRRRKPRRSAGQLRDTVRRHRRAPRRDRRLQARRVATIESSGKAPIIENSSRAQLARIRPSQVRRRRRRVRSYTTSPSRCDDI